jgi:hypothetical protein
LKGQGHKASTSLPSFTYKALGCLHTTEEGKWVHPEERGTQASGAGKFLLYFESSGPSLHRAKLGWDGETKKMLGSRVRSWNFQRQFPLGFWKGCHQTRKKRARGASKGL